MESTDKPSNTVRDLLYVLFTHKTKMLIVFFGIVLFVATVSFTTPPTYRASGKILVKVGRENVYTPHVSNPSSTPAMIDPSREENINSEIEILKARSLAEKVIRNIGAEKIYPNIDAPGLLASVIPLRELSGEQKAVIQFGSKLKIQGIRKSNIVDVHFDHSDPAMASVVVNRLIDEFLGQHVAAHKQPQVYGLFDEQARKLQKTVQASEAKLQAFRNRHNISALQEQKLVLLKQISDTELDLARTRAAISEETGKGRSMQQSGGATSGSKFGKETDLNVAAISNIKNMIAALKLKEQELRSKYPEQNYLVVSIRKEIEKAEQLLADEEQTYHNKEVKTINHTLDALTQKGSTQNLHLARYKGEIHKINSMESELKQLERQAKIDEESYRLYMRKAEEGRISDAMDNQKIANISIVQPALVPLKPIAPRIKVNILLSMLLGGFAALCVALGAESMNRKFRRGEDVEKHLALPVLASLPKLKS